MIDRSLNFGREVIAGFFRTISPFESVLDIGAGYGYDLSAAAMACPESRRFAVEVYPPAVERLRSQNVEVLALDVERNTLPFEDESLDVVISNQTLEHVKEIFWILHEISRSLKLNGHFIIGVPNLASLHNRLLLLLGRQPSCLQNASAHVRGYTRSDILKVLSTVVPGGYQLAGFSGSNFYPFPPVLARPLAKALPSGAATIFLLLRKVGQYHGEFLEYPVRTELETNFYLGG